mgnify:CR=1 FL=1
MGYSKKISIVIPAKNEAGALSNLLPAIKKIMPDAEIIVVNDGSTDNTSEVCLKNEVEEVLHIYSKGNGSAVKSGARKARGSIIVFMDGDGQHKPEDIPRLLGRYQEGYDLVVGCRDSKSQASFGRLAANRIYNKLASWMVGHNVKDLTSGFRVVNAEKFKEFIYLLPNGFSYPTTSTMAFFRAGYSVCYEPIIAEKREGKSHINLVKDGVRFLLIIFKVGILYSPLKIYFPLAVLFAVMAGSYYGYTLFEYGRLTNMSVILFVSSIITFLFGLLSEQVTSLMYKKDV